ncbi:ABC transporter substrate-binding protein [Streptomyces sp. M19]
MKVGLIIAQSGSPTAVTDPGRVATIAAQAVNDGGGIHGRELDVRICDTKGQPASSLACARKLAGEGVVAFIGGSSANGIAKISKAKKITNWFPMGSDPTDVTNPLSFITALNSAGAAQGAYLGARRFDARSAVYVVRQGTRTYIDQAKYGYAQAGVRDVHVVEIPMDVTDYAPYIAKIKSYGTDVWGGMLYPPSAQTQLIQAASAAGLKTPFVSSNNVIENATIKALSKAPFPNSLALEKLEDADASPVWAEYQRQLTKYDPHHKVTGPSDGTTSTDWYAVWSFAQEAKKLKTVTVDSFREHVTKLTDFGPDIDSDLLHPIDFTKDSPVKGQPRQSNIWAYAGHVAGGTTAVDRTTPFSAWQKTSIRPWTAAQIKAATGK